MLSENCILTYDPKPVMGKAATMFKPWWLIASLEEGNEMRDYYSWLIQKRTGLKLIKPAWGAHISITRGEEPLNKESWGKYEGKKIKFNFDNTIKTNGGHWWLKVFCEEFWDIREELGLPRRHEIGLHLTIGAPSPIQEETSFYYTRFLQNIG